MDFQSFKEGMKDVSRLGEWKAQWRWDVVEEGQ